MQQNKNTSTSAHLTDFADPWIRYPSGNGFRQPDGHVPPNDSAKLELSGGITLYAEHAKYSSYAAENGAESWLTYFTIGGIGRQGTLYINVRKTENAAEKAMQAAYDAIQELATKTASGAADLQNRLCGTTQDDTGSHITTRNDGLAKSLRCLAQVRLAQEDTGRYQTQIADLEKELARHKFNLALRQYLAGQLHDLRWKYNRAHRFIQKYLAEHADTYSQIPDDIWKSARKFNFFVDDILTGRAGTIEDAIKYARAREAADPFWYAFNE